MKTSNVNEGLTKIKPKQKEWATSNSRGYNYETDALLAKKSFGVVKLYRHDFRDICFQADKPMEIANLHDYGCGDTISTLFVGKNTKIIVYEHTGFGGRSNTFSGNQAGSSKIGLTAQTHSWDAGHIHGPNPYNSAYLDQHDSISSIKIMWDYDSVHIDEPLKKACCGIVDNRNDSTFTDKVCGGTYKPGNDKCNNLWGEHCKKAWWDDKCIEWAKYNAPSAQTVLNKWCKTWPGAGQPICDCWDEAGWKKFADDFQSMCKEEGVNCVKLNDFRRDCVYPKCVLNKNSHDIWSATNNKPCPDNIIQNCVNSLEVGGNVNSEEIIQKCVLNIEKNQSPQHGGWSDWGAWGECDCNTNKSTKTRACNNPVPHNGGDDCEGDNKQTTDCNCSGGGGSMMLIMGGASLAVMILMLILIYTY